MKKLFISHASEDKDAFVRPLAEELTKEFDVWYDEYKLVAGMKLLEEIDKGLATCDHGIVVLSPHFFDKKWAQEELNGLFTLADDAKKTIIPVWHNATKEEVAEFSPIMASRLALLSTAGVDAVVDGIKRSVAFFDQGKFVATTSPGVSKLTATIGKHLEADASVDILRSQEGFHVALEAAKNLLQLIADQVDGVSGLRIKGPREDTRGCSLDIHRNRMYLRFEYDNPYSNTGFDARLRAVIYDSSADPFGRGKSEAVLDDSYALFVPQAGVPQWREVSSTAVYSAEKVIDMWLERFSQHIESTTKDPYPEY